MSGGDGTAQGGDGVIEVRLVGGPLDGEWISIPDPFSREPTRLRHGSELNLDGSVYIVDALNATAMLRSDDAGGAAPSA